ncbi:SDR family NAD(P)-dependent oxidoreductase [Pedobacter sp. JCM 36344]|uniref:SDR family NAD(P)-dependent oxidoreductase n=1 Tax=Pedobacter sp. JCM 36344 TaxID=3374280 RepID=UPI003978F870
MGKYALVTGASKGIGREVAIQLAKRGYDLLLIARSENELQELSEHLNSTYHVSSFYLAADLSTPGMAAKVSEWANSKTTSLSVLINNAGFGLWGSFDALPIHAQMEMLQLNINAVLELTHHLLPGLKTQKEAYILNVASTAAYQAMPSMALYAASKSFVLSYSRAIRYELKNTNVAVSCLSPGPTATGFGSRAGLDAFAELAEKFNMPASVVAEIGVKGMFKKKPEIIAGFLNKISAYGATFLPKALIERISANLYRL